jgi:hypothetical protein
MRALLDRLTYANVMATIAVFIALGGSAYAVSKIDGSNIRNRSLTGKEFKTNSLGGKVIKESSLRPVPRAQNAARLGGKPASDYRDRCSQAFGEMKPVAGWCLEVASRPPEPYGSAVLACASTDDLERPGRQLPPHGVLMAALVRPDFQLAPGGELIGQVAFPPTIAGTNDALYIAEENGRVERVPDNGDGAKSFRCAAPPTN